MKSLFVKNSLIIKRNYEHVLIFLQIVCVIMNKQSHRRNVL